VDETVMPYRADMPTGADLVQDAVLVTVLVVAVVLMAALLRIRHGPATTATTSDEAGAEELPWVVVVANPTKVDSVPARRDWVAQASTRYGLGTPVWLETTVEDPGLGQAGTAVEIGAHAVLAYGGDGTVRSVASRLAGSAVPLGLLPSGTGNLLARNLGLPVNDLDTALTVALTGQDRKIDVGRVTLGLPGQPDIPLRREAFLVMTGLGFDAEVMASVEPRLKKHVGWWAYVVAGARLLRGPQTKITIEMDSGPILHRRIRSVIVGNCGELTAGLRLLPDAHPDDGWLDLVTVAPRGVVGWGAVIAAVLSGSRRGHPIVEHFRCRQVAIRAEKPLPVQVDGDPSGSAQTMSASLEPLGLVIRMPDPAP
jgi:diacylglycerol kinase family enzyme